MFCVVLVGPLFTAPLRLRSKATSYSHAKGTACRADSIFVDLVGRDPSFLVAFGAYATFSNCLFRNVRLPRSELFDVSMGGAVTLLNCHFSNISTGPVVGGRDKS